MKIITPETQAPAPSAEELKFLAKFRSLDDETQQFLHRYMADLTERFPRRNAPSLRLITGGTN